MATKHKSNGKKEYGLYPYETKCTVCGKYYYLEEDPDCPGFDESKMRVYDSRPWWATVIGSPHFYFPDHSLHGKALRADHKLKRDKNGQVIEDAETYWKRVRKELQDAR